MSNKVTLTQLINGLDSREFKGSRTEYVGDDNDNDDDDDVDDDDDDDDDDNDDDTAYGPYASFDQFGLFFFPLYKYRLFFCVCFSLFGIFLLFCLYFVIMKCL